MLSEKGHACRPPAGRTGQAGQSLIELMVVMAVGVLVVGALVFATISSLRNANLAKNQSQATKLAQEGIEKVRSIRDRDDGVQFGLGGGDQTEKFSHLWVVKMNENCDGPCYFKLDLSQKSLIGVNSASFETINSNFTRQIWISDIGSSFQNEKTINVIVVWSDFSGKHESKLTTVLRKL